MNQIKHHTRSPFPFAAPKSGALITDERCRCGALRSQHGDTLAYGHGARIVGDVVTCERFTWEGWVFTSALLRGRIPLDDVHAVEVERTEGGWKIRVYDMSKRGGGAKLFSTVAKVTAAGERVRTKLQAVAWAKIELRHHLERKAVAS